ncbi:MAG: CHRD domain-containing protein [Burkholderiaceae bacterium]
MTTNTLLKRLFAVCAALVLAALGACSSMGGMGGMGGAMAGTKLSGDQEVPPVTTSATGTSMINVAADGSVSGSVSTTGVDGTMAHIHMAPSGKNGPVVVPLTKGAQGAWMVAPGAKLTAEQLKAYQAGELYVNVHSAANKGGEIRAQMKP